MAQSGDTSTSELSQHGLILRFLSRTQTEIAQMRQCLPRALDTLRPAAISQIERLAHKIAATAEPFGFPEIGAIAGAVELMAHQGASTAAERLELSARLADQLAALEEHLQQALADSAAVAAD